MKHTRKELKESRERAVRICHEVFMEGLIKWVKRGYGKRCDDFAAGCGVCQAWKVLDYLNDQLLPK